MDFACREYTNGRPQETKRIFPPYPFMHPVVCSLVLPLLLAVPCFATQDSPAPISLHEAARRQIGHVIDYDPAYVRLPYPGGDVSPHSGVCTDVVIRALRVLGLDLQQAIHEDMRAHFSAYPKLWGLTRPDRNIDHRRVPNQECFFRRRGWE